MAKAAVTLITILCLTVLLILPAQAAALPKEVEAIQAAGRLQAIRLLAMCSFDAQVFLGREVPLSEGLAAEYDSLLEQLSGLAGVGEADRKRVTKYYNKVLARDAEIAQLEEGFTNIFTGTGKVDLSISTRLALLAARYRYAMDELVRHLVAVMDLAELDSAVQISFTESLHLMDLQRVLLTAILRATKNNYPGYAEPADEFWFSLGRFDYSLQIYKAFIQTAGLASERAQAVETLEEIKHGVVMRGEALFIENQNNGQPTEETVMAVIELQNEVFDLFSGLLP